MASILVVEDDPQARTALCWLLERDGHTVDAAGSVDAALEMIDRRRRDVIITDWMLETATARRIIERVQRDRPATPIIVVTAHADQVRALEDDAIEATLQKPFDYPTLRRLLGRLLQT